MLRFNDNDITAYFTVDYHVSPSLSFEGGVITGHEVSASLPSSASGTWHGTKSYSTSGALTITTKTDNIYLFGVKYEPLYNLALLAFTVKLACCFGMLITLLVEVELLPTTAQHTIQKRFCKLMVAIPSLV